MSDDLPNLTRLEGPSGIAIIREIIKQVKKTSDENHETLKDVSANQTVMSETLVKFGVILEHLVGDVSEIKEATKNTAVIEERVSDNRDRIKSIEKYSKNARRGGIAGAGSALVTVVVAVAKWMGIV